LRVRDLARRFSVSEVTIRAWIKSGKLPPPLPFAGKKRWDATLFEQWFREQTGGGPHAAK
jgi:predicted site-specific integrase-resolvase